MVKCRLEIVKRGGTSNNHNALNGRFNMTKYVVRSSSKVS